MILRGRLPLFVVCLVLAAIASEAPGRAAGGAGAGVPLLTSATADLDAGTLTIVGQNFVSSPLPRVYMGTEAGGLIELLVDSATSTSVVARLAGTTLGTYRVVVQFGRTGLVFASMDVTIGAVGPTGEKGEKGEKGDKGDPGPGLDLSITDALYARLLGNNSYSGNQNIQGSLTVQGSVGVQQAVTAARFVGDGSGLTNVGFARIGGPCVLDHTPDSDPEPDAVGVIVGFDSLGNATCRALIGSECKVLVTPSGRRILRGRELAAADLNARIPPDASNCTVPDGGPVGVEGPRPNLSGARIRNVAVEPLDDWSFADLSRADIWLGASAILAGANLRGATLQTNGGHDLHGADATGLVITGGLSAQLIADDATLAYARMRLVEAPGSSFKRANLRMASLSSPSPSRLTGASFLEADLFRANLTDTECRVMGLTAGCDFTRAKLRETNLQGLRCNAGGRRRRATSPRRTSRERTSPAPASPPLSLTVSSGRTRRARTAPTATRRTVTDRPAFRTCSRAEGNPKIRPRSLGRTSFRRQLPTVVREELRT